MKEPIRIFCSQEKSESERGISLAVAKNEHRRLMLKTTLPTNPPYTYMRYFAWWFGLIFLWHLCYLVCVVKCSCLLSLLLVSVVCYGSCLLSAAIEAARFLWEWELNLSLGLDLDQANWETPTNFHTNETASEWNAVSSILCSIRVHTHTPDNTIARTWITIVIMHVPDESLKEEEYLRRQ